MAFPDLTRSRKNVLVSSACLAACLVAAFDLAASITHPLAAINTVNLDKGESYNTVVAIEKERKDTTAGAVFLLGSSLMVAPALQDEATYRQEPFKRFHDRRLKGFESYLSAALQSASIPVENKAVPPAYLLAVGGEMVSDAFILTREILSQPFMNAPGKKENICIVYGIAPRDFHDNLLPRVDASPVFKIFAKMDDLPQLFESEPTLSAVDKGSACAERLSSFYRYRGDWQNLATIRAKRLIEKCLPFVVFEKYSDSLSLKQQKKGLLPGEALGTPQVVPQVALDHDSWLATEDEYKRRYNPYKPARYQAQFAYFERLLRYCQEGKATLIVVNMPLSTDNMKLLPPGTYQRYITAAAQMCNKYGVEFVDLNQMPWNKTANFVDSVHLNPQVSKAFLQKLAALAARSNVAVAARSKQPAL